MCGQLNFDCLEYFNFDFNVACISIISISIVETKYFGQFHLQFFEQLNNSLQCSVCKTSTCLHHHAY